MSNLLDIIIPTYHNQKGLRETLDSALCYENITITVVCDCDGEDYSSLLHDYPQIHFYMLPENVGPGNTRQSGLEHTSCPFIMFVDTGDIILDLKPVFNIITTDTVGKMYSWRHRLQEDNGTERVEEHGHARVHGRVYRRSFIDQYNIHFHKEGSRSNEDAGFNQLCRLILKDKDPDGYVNYDDVILLWTCDPNSITRKNNHEFIYTQNIFGLVVNSIYTAREAEKLQLNPELIVTFVYNIMVSLYSYFLDQAAHHPKHMQKTWSDAKYFYDNLFIEYKDRDAGLLDVVFKNKMKAIENSATLLKIRPNIKRFLNELSQYDEYPTYYMVDFE